MRRAIAIAAIQLMLLVTALTSLAKAQEDASAYPSRMVRLVVGFAPGGTVDVLARLVADRLEKRWGKQVIVENRTGAAGNIGMVEVAKSQPDGYTLAIVPVGNAAVNQFLFKDLPYDPVADFAPITQIATVENVLVVSAKSPIKTVKDLIATAKAPGSNVTYSSPGAGSQAHLAGEMLARAAGVQLTHVAYRGLAQALTDTIGQQVTATFTQLSLAKPFIQRGELRALGVASKGRSPALPDVPTVAEAAGVPDFEAISWYALMAPAGTPKAITEKIQQEVAGMVREDGVRASFAAQGATPVGGSAEDLARIIKEDSARWSKVVREAGIKLD